MKELPWVFQQSFRPFSILIGEGCSETELFRHLSNPVFSSAISKIYKLKGSFLFQTVQNLISISEIEPQIRKRSLFLR